MNAVVAEASRMPAVTNEPATPMLLVQMAIQNGADIDKLEKLMGLQERWEANQARKAFDAAMSEAKAQIKPIVKKREVDFPARNGGSRTNYMYEDMALIANEVDPILSNVGLSYRYRSKQDGKKLYVTCVISHRDGHSEETTLTAENDESGNKNSIQAIGSAATYLQRYTLKLALGLSAAKDDDGKASSGDVQVITEREAMDLKAKAEEVGADIPNFLKYLKVEKFGDLPAAKFKAAVEVLNQRAKNRGAK